MDTQTILAEINKLNSELQKSQCNQSSDLIATSERQNFAAETRQRHQTTHILDNLRDTDSEVKDAIERRGSENYAATMTTFSDLRASQERLAGQGQVQAEKNTNELVGYASAQAVRSTQQYGDTLYKMKEVEKNIGDYFNTTRVEVLNVGNNVERQSSAQFAKTQADLFKIESSLGRQADYNFAATQKQASDNYANIQIEALKLNGALSKQMVECCCDVKQTVAASEDNVKSLINANETDRLRARLLATENALVERNHGWGRGFGHGGRWGGHGGHGGHH
jgi:hypothetical protein